MILRTFPGGIALFLLLSGLISAQDDDSLAGSFLSGKQVRLFIFILIVLLIITYCIFKYFSKYFVFFAIYIYFSFYFFAFSR